jgi:hypothetical protein
LYSINQLPEPCRLPIKIVETFQGCRSPPTFWPTELRRSWNVSMKAKKEQGLPVKSVKG